jgi:hypothetical protein
LERLDALPVSVCHSRGFVSHLAAVPICMQQGADLGDSGTSLVVVGLSWNSNLSASSVSD